MLFLYLDESGDLGFDFITKKPSKFFTVCISSDLFAWGILRKYEKKDAAWFSVFRKKVVFDDVYLP